MDTRLEEARRGDMAAFAELFEPLRPMVFAIARRLAGDVDAEDVVMDTYLKAWRALPRFNGRASLKTWLYRIARNAAIDHLRIRQRHAGVVLPGDGEEPGDVGDLPDPAGRTAAEEVVTRETIDGVSAALDTLSPDMRATLLLRFADGMSYADIAEVMGLSQKAIKSLLSRARVNLRQIIERSAAKLEVSVDAEGAREIAARARGTPRIANNLLRRVRDYAQVRAGNRITQNVAAEALSLLEIDPRGLDEMDLRILETLVHKFSGGPVGLNTIAVSVGEEPDTIEEVYEPFLIQEGYLERTPKGRLATPSCYQRLGLAVAARQNELPL